MPNVSLYIPFFHVVSDGGQERQLAENKFTIRVLPVNNNPPVFVKSNPKVNLSEGGIFPLSSEFLEVIDPDTELSNLKISMTEAPKRGLVRKIQEGITVQVRAGKCHLKPEEMK